MIPRAALPDDLARVIDALPEERRRAALVWCALMNDFPDSFPFPQNLDNAAAGRLVRLLEFLTDELAHAE